MLYRTISTLEARNRPTGILRLTPNPTEQEAIKSMKSEARITRFVGPHAQVMTLLQRMSVAGAVLATIALMSCAGATTKPATDPEPKPAPLSGLAGTWAITYGPFEEDGQMLTTTMYLTLVANGRFVEAFEEQNEAGQRVGHWHGSGGWTATDDTIDKIWHDDDGTTPSVTKQYYFADDNNTLFVHPWSNDDPEHNFERLTRVTDPLPANLDGTWTYFNMYNNVDWTVTFDGDQFSFTGLLEDGALAVAVAGLYSYDRTNYAVNFTDLVQTSADGTTGAFNQDGIGRFSIAPSPGGGLRVSPFWEEPPVADPQEIPYGEYWMLLSREL